MLLSLGFRLRHIYSLYLLTKSRSEKKRMKGEMYISPFILFPIFNYYSFMFRKQWGLGGTIFQIVAPVLQNAPSEVQSDFFEGGRSGRLTTS